MMFLSARRLQSDATKSRRFLDDDLRFQQLSPSRQSDRKGPTTSSTFSSRPHPAGLSTFSDAADIVHALKLATRPTLEPTMCEMGAAQARRFDAPNMHACLPARRADPDSRRQQLAGLRRSADTRSEHPLARMTWLRLLSQPCHPCVDLPRVRRTSDCWYFWCTCIPGRVTNVWT